MTNGCLTQATAAAVDTFLIVFNRTLKTSFSKLLQQRLDLTTENLWILFEGHYRLIGRYVSRKFQIPLSKKYLLRISLQQDLVSALSLYNILSSMVCEI